MKPYTSCKNHAKKLAKILGVLIFLAVILTVVRQAYLEQKQLREEEIKTEKNNKKRRIIVHKIYRMQKIQGTTRKHEPYK